MSLSTEVVERLTVNGVSERTTALVMAALRGRTELELSLAGDAEPFAASSEAAAPPGSPDSVYLTDIAVEGFRGIGPTSTLSFKSGPGLTVVVGRNGSGKSSFADALEVALTGDSYRWIGKAAEWKNGWRNLHQPAPTRVQVRFQSVAGSTVVERAWSDSAKSVAESTEWAQHHGRARTDLAGLGWTSALAAHRPLLSYAELGLIASNPSSLFDALSGVLGLDEVNAAAGLLRQVRLEQEGIDKDAKKRLKDLLGQLATVDDHRAQTCIDALSGRTWDLGAVEAVTAGGESSGGELGSLAALRFPDRAELAAVAERLRVAGSALAELAGTDTHRAHRLADLLGRALEHHSHEGDAGCPVCGSGTLDGLWREHAEEQVRLLGAEAARFDEAQAGASSAMSEARLLANGPRLPPSGGPIDIEELRSAWATFATMPDGPAETAEHLVRAGRDVEEATNQVVSKAEQLYSAREEEWRPLAMAVAAWVERARAALVARPVVEELKRAEEAAKRAAGELRSRRFEPIATQALELWRMLRLQSNVELTSVELSGDGTRRRVDLAVSVDGTDGAALGVVSQGEINCLALSLFFPRATLPESPFRFLVIDDPVQAMDPARVDGLAQVFSRMAADRQVIVFTHDDRLPESLRRLSLQHTITEVTRRPGSVVTVRDTLDPVLQYFKDAWAVAKDDQLLDGVASRIVPGICRLGIEAACVERIRRERIGAGETHLQVEADIEAAKTLNQMMALALFGDAGQASRVLPTLNGWGKQLADVFRDCNSGAHGGFSGPLTGLVNEAKSLAIRVRR